MKVIKQKFAYRSVNPRRELIRCIRYLPDDKIELLLNTAKSFKVTEPSFNSETLSAIEDVKQNRNMSKTFNSIDELMADLNA